jgi:hypothetical protein
MLSESYKNRLLELAGVISEITSKEAFDKFYSDTTKFPTLKGDEELFNKINDTIPSDSNQFNRGYFEWLYRLYSKGNIPINKLDKVKEYLHLFKAYINVIPQEDRDISKLKSIEDLYDIVKEFEGKEDIIPVSKTQVLKKIKKEEVDKVFDDGEWIILVPKSKRASCIIGKGTQWCTAAEESDNYFDSYNEEGKLYVIIDKENNNKYQLHIEREELKDENNHNVEPLFFFEHVTGDSDLADFFMKENIYFHHFILSKGLEEIDYGGWSELFFEVLHDVYSEDSKIKMSETTKEYYLNYMRESRDNPDLVYYGFLYEKNPDNISREEIKDLVTNKNTEKEDVDRVFSHLAKIGFDFEGGEIGFEEYVEALNNLKAQNKKVGANYVIDKNYVVRINFVDITNKSKPYNVTLRHSEKGEKTGNVNIESLNNLLNQGILFEKNNRSL